MKKLTTDAYGRAVAFVNANARPVDAALLAFYFEDGRGDAVVNALAAFQNDDGGFGNAMEPDFRVPESSVTATTVAFQYLVAVRASADHPVVQRGIAYLREQYDEQAKAWPPVCKTISEHPRANWWEYYPPVNFEPTQASWGNPNVEVIGYLHRCVSLLDERFVNERVAQAQAWLSAVDKAEAHELLCAMRFAQAMAPPARARALARVAELAVKVANTDPAAWPTYQAQPVWFARHPHEPAAAAFGDALAANLDFLIDAQSDDGSWPPTWQWGRYEDDWPAAKREWAGHLTVANLKLLSDFGRIQ